MLYLVLLVLNFSLSYLILHNFLPSFSIFYLVLASFSEFYLFLPSFTELYRFLPSCTELYRVVPSFTELNCGLFRWTGRDAGVDAGLGAAAGGPAPGAGGAAGAPTGAAGRRLDLHRSGDGGRGQGHRAPLPPRRHALPVGPRVHHGRPPAEPASQSLSLGLGRTLWLQVRHHLRHRFVFCFDLLNSTRAKTAKRLGSRKDISGRHTTKDDAVFHQPRTRYFGLPRTELLLPFGLKHARLDSFRERERERQSRRCRSPKNAAHFQPQHTSDPRMCSINESIASRNRPGQQQRQQQRQQQQQQQQQQQKTQPFPEIVLSSSFSNAGRFCRPNLSDTECRSRLYEAQQNSVPTARSITKSAAAICPWVSSCLQRLELAKRRRSHWPSVRLRHRGFERVFHDSRFRIFWIFFFPNI